MKGMEQMASFKKYRNKKDGKQYWMCQAYLGTDEMTGKSVRVTRRRGEDGSPLRTKREAENEVLRLQSDFNNGGFNEFKGKNKRELSTFEEVANEWLEKRYKETVRESTYLATKHMFFDLHILPRL